MVNGHPFESEQSIVLLLLETREVSGVGNLHVFEIIPLLAGASAAWRQSPILRTYHTSHANFLLEEGIRFSAFGHF